MQYYNQSPQEPLHIIKTLRNLSLWLFLFSVLMVSNGCFTSSKKVQQEPTVVVEPKPPKVVDRSDRPLPPPPPPEVDEPVHVPPTDNSTDSQTDTDVPVYEPPAPINKKYQMAIMLPFKLSTNGGNFSGSDKQTVMATEFYEGLLLGIESLRRKGLEMDVRVLDTENSESRTQQLLTDPILQQMDIIIGPLYNKPLKKVAEFAKFHQIYQVAPLSPSVNNTSANPYYLMASPPIETHCEAMYRYVSEQYPSGRVLAIAGNRGNEISLANLVYNLSNFANTGGVPTERNSYRPLPVMQLTYLDQTADDLEAYLSPTEPNIIMLTSFDGLVINDVTRHLLSLRKKYDIKLFGMPNWTKIPTLELDYISKLNFHMTTPYFHNPNDPYQLQFNKLYKQVFNGTPSEYTAAGYDLVRYFGLKLLAHGSEFHKYFNDTDNRGIFTSFDFAPASPIQYSNEFFNTEYLENKYVNIIRLHPEDLIFQRVN